MSACSDNATDPTPGCDFWAYNPGWVIIDGKDPTRILQRSTVPLLSPQFGWEQGVQPFMCNVHNVTFIEAAARVPNEADDVIDVWFGGSDAGQFDASVTFNLKFVACIDTQSRRMSNFL